MWQASRAEVLVDKSNGECCACGKIGVRSPTQQTPAENKHAPTIDTMILTVIRKGFLPVTGVRWVNGAVGILAPECDEVGVACLSKRSST